MIKFSEWFEKRVVLESDINNSMSGQSLGGNAFISGLNKLQRGLQAGEVSRGYVGGYGVIGNKFGLSSKEMDEILKYKVLVRGQDGMDISIDRLQMFLKQLPGQSPNPRVSPLGGI